MSSSKQGHWLDTMTSRGYWENRPDFADAMRGDGQTLHFHATDAPGEWLARREPDMVVLERTPTRTSRSAAQPPSYCSCSAGVARWTPLLRWNSRGIGHCSTGGSTTWTGSPAPDPHPPKRFVLMLRRLL